VAGELDAQRAVAELTQHLSEEVAEVVVLRVVAGLSVEQVAALTGRSAGAVRVLQHRALRKLARTLRPADRLEAQEA
jgi:RNA polymerase sigma-70 factor (ECF subfamily)